jgi:hypothetical protein
MNEFDRNPRIVSVAPCSKHDDQIDALSQALQRST